MWEVSFEPSLKSSYKRFSKSNERETLAVFENLNTYKAALDQTDNPPLAGKGLSFIHPEPCGMVAIDEKGCGLKSPKALRLYAYPDVGTRTILVIEFGDKDSQKRDINFCRDYLRRSGVIKKQ